MAQGRQRNQILTVRPPDIGKNTVLYVSEKRWYCHLKDFICPHRFSGAGKFFSKMLIFNGKSEKNKKTIDKRREMVYIITKLWYSHTAFLWRCNDPSAGGIKLNERNETYVEQSVAEESAAGTGHF